MKKTFKLFAIAIAACSLFVACGDDDDDELVVENNIGVNFGGKEWLAQEILGDDYSQSYGQIGLGVYKDYEDEDAPYTEGYCKSTVSHEVWNGTTDNYMAYAQSEEDVTETEDFYFLNWQPVSFDENITAIDLDGCTFTGVFSGILYNFPEAMEPDATMADVTKKDITLTINNATWEWINKGNTFKNLKAK